MKNLRCSILSIIFSFSVCIINAQTIKQLNGVFDITGFIPISSTQIQITGKFTDSNNEFTASMVMVGDQIIDANGNGYEIISLGSVSGTTIMPTCLNLNNTSPVSGSGILFRPSNNGYPLIAAGTPSNVLNTALNTTTLSINGDIPSFQTGTNLPLISYVDGNIVICSADSKLYKLVSSNWSVVTTAPKSKFVSNVALVPIDVAGTIIKLVSVGKYYYSDGTSWIEIPTVSSLPILPKYGDVYYVTVESALYMCVDDGFGNVSWMSISNSGVSSGGTGDFPATPRPGLLYFNTDNNTLYLFDMTNTWVEISTNGSTPGDMNNPDPGMTTIKEGRLFYNTSEHQLYVFNGTIWIPLGNALPDAQIYVGNTSNIATPVSLSGDATITSAGKLTINNAAITDSKLDKVNIPLSGFGNAKSNVSMGDGSTNYRITNLLNPAANQDAANKGYVDNLFSNPSSILTLPLNNLFVGNAQNKAIATSKTSIPLSGFGNPTSNISMNGKLITNLGLPSSGTDAVNKNYVDNLIIYPININLLQGMLLMGNNINQASMAYKEDIPFSDFGPATIDVSLGGFKLTSLADPVAAQDASTKNYVDTKIFPSTNIALASGNLLVGNSSGVAAATLKNAIPLSGFGAAMADISMGSSRIVSLGAPIADTDASTKKYVDDLFLSPSNILSLAAGSFFVGNSFGKAAPTIKTSIPISGFGKATETVYMGDLSTQYNISNLAEPMSEKDAATKNYVDTKIANPSSITVATGYILVGNAANQAEAVAKSTISLSDFGAVNANLSLANYKIINLADPVSDGDAVNKKYITTQLSNVSTLLSLPEGQLFVGNASGKAIATVRNTIPLSGFALPTTDIAFGTKKITGLGDPTADQDAATKKYVDGLVTSSALPALTDGKIFVGNASGKAGPVSLSGDASIDNTGKMTIANDAVSAAKLNADVAGTGLKQNLAGALEVDPTTISGGSISSSDLLVTGGSNAALTNVAISIPNKAITDAKLDKTNIPLSGFAAAAADVALGNFKLTGVADPAADQDAATKKYVDSQLATVNSALLLPQGNMLVGDANGKAASTAKGAITLSGFKDAEANISMGTGSNNYKIINVADPTGDQDAATKKYVDNTAAASKDNLGNHTATQALKMGSYSVSNDGDTGDGVAFDTDGHATFGKDVTVNGNFYTPSDERLKTDVETLTNVLEKINNLRGVQFEYKDQKKYAKGPKMGVIAQELLLIYPGMVTKGDDGYLKVDYTQLTAVLIQAVKEQQQQIKQQQQDIDEMKVRLDKQQQQINSILMQLK